MKSFDSHHQNLHSAKQIRDIFAKTRRKSEPQYTNTTVGDQQIQRLGNFSLFLDNNRHLMRNFLKKESTLSSRSMPVANFGYYVSLTSLLTMSNLQSLIFSTSTLFIVYSLHQIHFNISWKYRNDGIHLELLFRINRIAKYHFNVQFVIQLYMEHIYKFKRNPSS